MRKPTPVTEDEYQEAPRRIAAKGTALMKEIIARAKASPKIGDLGLQEFIALSETTVEHVATLETRTGILSDDATRVRDPLTRVSTPGSQW